MRRLCEKIGGGRRWLERCLIRDLQNGGIIGVLYASSGVRDTDGVRVIRQVNIRVSAWRYCGVWGGQHGHRGR